MTPFETIEKKYQKALELDPTSIIIKNIVNQKYGLRIPITLVIFNEIVSYINTQTITQPTIKQTSRTTPIQRTIPTLKFDVQIDYSVYGTACYTDNYTGITTIALPANTFEDWRDVDKSDIIDVLRDEFFENEVDYLDDLQSDISYNDHERNDSELHDLSCSNISDIIDNFLSEYPEHDIENENENEDEDEDEDE